jgi:sulfatase maturation enzyme AslB (radical SAM superfamily)
MSRFTPPFLLVSFSPFLCGGNKKIDKVFIRRNYLINECSNCEIEGICMGHCRAENESVYKENGCAFHKEMFRNLLSNIFKLKE